MGPIHAEKIQVGDGARIGEDVVISGPDGAPARSVVIGDGAVLEDGVRVTASEVHIGAGAVLQRQFVARATSPGGSIHLGDGVFLGHDGHALAGSLFVGDYTKLHNHLFIHGPGHMHLGHNCWVGGNCVIDGLGGFRMGDNVGVGAHSQLWSHMQFGDLLAGCRWYSRKEMVIEEDVWLVGHCIVSPIRARRRSMALVGSVITRDMEENHVYGGVPAKDMTDKVGPQFDNPPYEARLERFSGYLDQFYSAHPQFQERTLVAVPEYDDAAHPGRTQFHLMERSYTKRATPQERAFLSFVTPTLAKFVPRGWVCPTRAA